MNNIQKKEILELIEDLYKSVETEKNPQVKKLAKQTIKDIQAVRGLKDYQHMNSEQFSKVEKIIDDHLEDRVAIMYRGASKQTFRNSI